MFGYYLISIFTIHLLFDNCTENFYISKSSFINIIYIARFWITLSPLFKPWCIILPLNWNKQKRNGERRMGESGPVNAKLRFSAGKVLATFFFKRCCLLYVDFWTNADYYCKDLSEVRLVHRFKPLDTAIPEIANKSQFLSFFLSQ